MAAILISVNDINYLKTWLAITEESIYARSVLKNCGKKKDKLSLWLQSPIERRGFNKAAVALANKNARILWAMASHEKEYDALLV